MIITCFKSLQIEGNRAYGEIYRTEPNRVGTWIHHKYNVDYELFEALYRVHFVKKDGQWWIDKLFYKTGIVPYKTNNLRYFDLIK